MLIHDFDWLRNTVCLSLPDSREFRFCCLFVIPRPIAVPIVVAAPSPITVPITATSIAAAIRPSPTIVTVQTTPIATLTTDFS